MRINRKLNLVVPIYEDMDDDDSDGAKKTAPLRAVVHSVPIGPETFDAYFEPIGQVFTAIHARGFGAISGTRLADKLLRTTSIAAGTWESDAKTGRIGVKDGLVEEVHRLTNVKVPGERGWRDLMYQEAKDEGLLTAEDAAEVDAALIFFTVASCMYPHRELKKILDGAMSLWGAHVTSCSYMELSTSSLMLTLAGNTGAKKPG